MRLGRTGATSKAIFRRLLLNNDLEDKVSFEGEGIVMFRQEKESDDTNKEIGYNNNRNWVESCWASHIGLSEGRVLGL